MTFCGIRRNDVHSKPSKPAVATSSRASGTPNQVRAVWTSDLRDSSAGAPTCNLRRQADACFDRKNMRHLYPTQNNIGKPLPLETLNWDNKALNRSVLRLGVWLVVGWSWPPIVSDSVFTNLHFSSARLTRALYRLASWSK